MQSAVGDPRRVDSYLKADVSANTCVIVQDPGKRGLKRILTAIQDAGGTLVYVLGNGHHAHPSWNDELRTAFPDVTHLEMAELVAGPLLAELSRALTPRQGATVSALLRRRGSGAHPAAQRPGSGRHGQRAGAAKRAPPHEDHGHHRGDGRGHPAGESADGQPARHSRRDDHPGVALPSSIGSRRSTSSRTTSATGCSARTW